VSDNRWRKLLQNELGKLERGVFKILLNEPQGLPAHEVLLKMEDVVPPTPFEKSDYPNRPGLRRFEKMVRFATIGPVKAGWLVKDKGRWYLTEEGKKGYATFTDPEAFRRETSRLYSQWRGKNPKQINDSIIDDVSTIQNESDPTSTFEEAEENAWSEIEQYVQAMPPFDLQKLVAALLRAMGYHVAWIAPPGPDKGIDILANIDPLGTSAPRIKVQVKRRADKISVDGLRSFMAVGRPGCGNFRVYRRVHQRCGIGSADKRNSKTDTSRPRKTRRPLGEQLFEN
jgi:restriction system protein